VTPADTIQLARQFLTGNKVPLGANRSVVAAILTRRALESILDEFWQVHLPGMVDCSSRAQLITLPYYLPDQQLAAEVTYAWSALSASCHHSVNALPPAASEITHLMGIVQNLVDYVATDGGLVEVVL
jgi:hypothetical protein